MGSCCSIPNESARIQWRIQDL
ncbi:hypothetical protein L195_g057346, partial [Trifolium pratense]